MKTVIKITTVTDGKQLDTRYSITDKILVENYLEYLMTMQKEFTVSYE